MNDPTDVLAIHILSSLYPMIGDSHGMVLHAPLFFLVRLNLPHVVLLGHRGRLRQPSSSRECASWGCGAFLFNKKTPAGISTFRRSFHIRDHFQVACCFLL